MSSFDQQAPPVGEEIHLPGPTLQPLLLTVGLTMLIVGVTTTMIFVIAGAILAIGVTIRWIADTRRDVAALPLEHEHH
jgi:hypothetical protein